MTERANSGETEQTNSKVLDKNKSSFLPCGLWTTLLLVAAVLELLIAVTLMATMRDMPTEEEINEYTNMADDLKAAYVQRLRGQAHMSSYPHRMHAGDMFQMPSVNGERAWQKHHSSHKPHHATPSYLPKRGTDYLNNPTLASALSEAQALRQQALHQEAQALARRAHASNHHLQSSSQHREAGGYADMYGISDGQSLGGRQGDGLEELANDPTDDGHSRHMKKTSRDFEDLHAKTKTHLHHPAHQHHAQQQKSEGHHPASLAYYAEGGGHRDWASAHKRHGFLDGRLRKQQSIDPQAVKDAMNGDQDAHSGIGSENADVAGDDAEKSINSGVRSEQMHVASVTENKKDQSYSNPESQALDDDMDPMDDGEYYGHDLSI